MSLQIAAGSDTMKRDEYNVRRTKNTLDHTQRHD